MALEILFNVDFRRCFIIRVIGYPTSFLVRIFESFTHPDLTRGRTYSTTVIIAF